MSRKQRQPADDGKIQFELINSAIDQLLKQLAAKGACPCCVSQGMMWRGAFLHREVAGVDNTISLCMDVADVIEDNTDDDEMSETQH